jgi:ribose transport system ATP-binding protein
VPIAVKVRDVTKSFGGANVLEDVCLDAHHGEVHAIVGGNGAGKSTLMKILVGVYRADQGQIEVRGGDRAGSRVAMIHQEFSLIPELTVAQNVYLGIEPRSRLRLIDDTRMVAQTLTLLDQAGVTIDPRARVGTLSTAACQLTEIVKALARQPHVLIMDEPTASLNRTESESLLRLVRQLRDSGLSIIYISHRLEEVAAIADRVTVLRNGRVVATANASEISSEQLAQEIVGGQVAIDMQPRRTEVRGHAVLSVRDVASGTRLRKASIEVSRGEIVGLAGLSGSGRSALLRVIAGADRVSRGKLVVDGTVVEFRGIHDAHRHGVVLVPENRRTHGLVLDHSIESNILLAVLKRFRRRGMIDSKRSRAFAGQSCAQFAIKHQRLSQPVRLLSGGNQQRVVLAKFLALDPKVLLLDEPTAGIDIEAKAHLLNQLRTQADAGMAIVLVSSELQELLAVCDRIVIMRHGQTVAEQPRQRFATEDDLYLAVQGAGGVGRG